MLYCPNCSAEFVGPQALSACWNCRADLGLGSAWQPTRRPVGRFRVFSESSRPTKQPVRSAKELHPVADILAHCASSLNPIVRHRKFTARLASTLVNMPYPWHHLQLCRTERDVLETDQADSIRSCTLNCLQGTGLLLCTQVRRAHERMHEHGAALSIGEEASTGDRNRYGHARNIRMRRAKAILVRAAVLSSR